LKVLLRGAQKIANLCRDLADSTLIRSNRAPQSFEPFDAVALETRSLVISSSPVLRPGFSLIYGKKIQSFCRHRQRALMVRWVRSTRHAGILSNRAELI